MKVLVWMLSIVYLVAVLPFVGFTLGIESLGHVERVNGVLSFVLYRSLAMEESAFTGYFLALLPMGFLLRRLVDQVVLKE
ncbi:MAG: hypothetical protein WC030_00680 [Candidatus Paceibacterota bacterium]